MASGDFTPFATQTEVQAAQDTADNANSAIGDASSGLTKQITDLDNQINTAGTGLSDRVSDLEQNGSSVMKFRTHSESGVYESGEVVQKDGTLYKANSAIDGSTNPVAFVVGVNELQWTLLGKKPDPNPLLIQNGSLKTDIMNQSGYGTMMSSLSEVDGANKGGVLLFDNNRGAVTFNTVGSVSGVKSNQDLLTKGDGDELYEPKATSNPVKGVLSSGTIIVNYTNESNGAWITSDLDGTKVAGDKVDTEGTTLTVYFHKTSGIGVRSNAAGKRLVHTVQRREGTVTSTYNNTGTISGNIYYGGAGVQTATDKAGSTTSWVYLESQTGSVPEATYKFETFSAGNQTAVLHWTRYK